MLLFYMLRLLAWSNEVVRSEPSFLIAYQNCLQKQTPEPRLKVAQNCGHALTLKSLILLSDPVFFNPWPLEFSFVPFPTIVMEFSF